MISAPTVSVVVPAYNAAWCIERAVRSVLAQTYRDFELIVVDDGSSDNTARVLSPFAAALRVVAKQNGGLSSARNAGVRAARGDLVAFLDADDWWEPTKLARQAALMAARPDLAFCSTAARLVAPDGTPLGEWPCGCATTHPTLDALFLCNGTIAGSGSAVMARADALARAGPFDERLRSLEDVDMWMRLAVVGGYACVDTPLAVITKRPDSMSRDLDVMRHAARHVMRKNRHLLPPEKRGAFWRHAYAGMLSDYAKWAWRTQRRGLALRDVATGLCIAPISRGRLMAGLLLTMLRNGTV